jgi:hypothetical protein
MRVFGKNARSYEGVARPAHLRRQTLPFAHACPRRIFVMFVSRHLAAVVETRPLKA